MPHRGYLFVAQIKKKINCAVGATLELPDVKYGGEG